uniref:CLIP domain-containing serine protease n=1 Tax=Corethrella appendiculata TaxID=1370023 RepID=U5EI42_9DIPT
MNLNLFIFLILFFALDAYALNETCTTPNNEVGICINARNCPQIIDLLLSNRTQEQSEFLKNSFCRYEDNQALVCCKSNTTTVNKINNATSNALLPQPGECGLNIEDRIVGGNKTQLDEFTWTARLLYDKSNGRFGYHCGGVLINEKYVLTAAHCCKNLPSTWQLIGVRLGEWDTKSDIDCEDDGDCAPAALDIDIAKITIHEDYHQENGADYNDLALLRLRTPIEYSPFVKPICLPFKNFVKEQQIEGTTATVAGWGQTENSTSSQFKLKANLNISTFDNCFKKFKDVGVRIEQNTQICAGGVKGVDSCRGDSGGPLVKVFPAAKNNVTTNYWFLVGIVSFGLQDCGTEGTPGVYTNVSNFLDWILENVEP